MVLAAFFRLATAHETLLAYEPVRVWAYDNIARQNSHDFLASLNESESRYGFPTFDWDYVEGRESTEESQGVHGYFDIWGIWLAWQRNPWLNGVTDAIGERFANTMETTINLGNSALSMCWRAAGTTLTQDTVSQAPFRASSTEARFLSSHQVSPAFGEVRCSTPRIAFAGADRLLAGWSFYCQQTLSDLSRLSADMR